MNRIENKYVCAVVYIHIYFEYGKSRNKQTDSKLVPLLPQKSFVGYFYQCGVCKMISRLLKNTVGSLSDFRWIILDLKTDKIKSQ